jgi:Co/Zn/Cd efflux system component
MDCPSEERMIRMALGAEAGIRSLSFDLARRELRVVHDGDPQPLLARLDPLGFGATLASSEECDEHGARAGQAAGPREAAAQGAELEGRTLRLLLAINAAMFVTELVAGWLAQSAGLIADSLDMLADACVYAVALLAVGRGPEQERRAARLAGWLQALLALWLLAEVARRFAFGSEPEPPAMILVSIAALAANVACLALVWRHRSGGAHMRASAIFSANDVLANAGVIVAGVLVAWTGSRLPDLLIGALIGIVVLHGARRILRLARTA